MPDVVDSPPPGVTAVRRRDRRGRLLMEVLIAMVLLLVGASASVALVRANVALTDRVAFLMASRAVTRAVAEDAQVAGCAAEAGEVQVGRTDIEWTPSMAGSVVLLSLSARGAPHPAGLPAPRPLTAELAGWCP